MLCEQCGDSEAVVHWTQVVDDQTTTRHLCDACARDEGIEQGPPAGANAPLANFLAQLGSDDPVAVPSGSDGCDFCGLTLSDFRETGRLGCPHCYSSFEGQLRNLLRRIHGGTRHAGKVYLPPDPTASERAKRLEVLRRKLDRAVETEHFERAAELRDEIRRLDAGTDATSAPEGDAADG